MVGKLAAVLVWLFGWLIDSHMRFGLVAGSVVAMLMTVGIFLNTMMTHYNNAEVIQMDRNLDTQV